MGAVRTKKWRKKRFLPPWPAAETIFLRSGQRVGLILLRIGAGTTYHSFKNTAKTFLKVLMAHILSLIDDLVALAPPTFLVSLSL
jgi:hypothetical protein